MLRRREVFQQGREVALAQGFETGRHDGLVGGFQADHRRALQDVALTGEIEQLNASGRLSIQTTGEGFPILRRHVPEPIIRLHGTIRIEDFGEDFRFGPGADPTEIGADTLSDAVDFVAHGTIGGEDLFAADGIAGPVGRALELGDHRLAIDRGPGALIPNFTSPRRQRRLRALDELLPLLGAEIRAEQLAPAHGIQQGVRPLGSAARLGRWRSAGRAG